MKIANTSDNGISGTYGYAVPSSNSINSFAQNMEYGNEYPSESTHMTEHVSHFEQQEATQTINATSWGDYAAMQSQWMQETVIRTMQNMQQQKIKDGEQTDQVKKA